LQRLIELEEDEFLEEYHWNYERKPIFVYTAVCGNELEATRVKEWNLTSYPEWCGAIKQSPEK
jgi:hypothetical protein